MAAELVNEPAFKERFQTIKEQIHPSQAKAALAVNPSLILLFWNLGKLIAEKQTENSWGNGVKDQLAKDLKVEFPGISGFSGANLFCP